MKAYTVHKFWHCAITGNVFVEVTWQVDGSEKAEVLPFSCKANALLYIRGQMKDWLLFCLEKYVNHKRYILKEYPNPDKAEHLAKCDNALEKYSSMDLHRIVQSVIKGLKSFQAILPHSDNPSYQSSLQNITEIELFCTTQINSPLQ